MYIESVVGRPHLESDTSITSNKGGKVEIMKRSTAGTYYIHIYSIQATLDRNQ